jgi:putative FmdB family regulatory protein
MSVEETMPTYEYRCESCGRSFDVVQGFHDASLTTCEVCAGSLRKVFAPVGIVFKGSGFYKTDSRSSKSRASSGGPKEDAGAPAKESSNGAEPSTSASKDGSKTTSSETGAGASPSKPTPSAGDGAKTAAPKAAPKPA